MSFQDNRNIPSSHPGHGQGPAGASLSDILTAIKNVAVNIANLQQTFLQVQGISAKQVSSAAPVLLKSGAGRVAMVNVTAVTGSSAGYLVDANNATSTSPVIYNIPNVVAATFVNLPFNIGLVIVLQGGMLATVSYS